MTPAFLSNSAPNAVRNIIRTLSILPLAASAFACAVAGSSAFAADKAPVKKEGSFGIGKSAGAYLTKEQLRACMAQQEKVKAQDADLLGEQAEITVQKAEIARVGDELKGKLEAVDRTSADAVAAYNDAVQARDRQIDAYRARVTAFNTNVDANHAAHDSFAQGCSSRRYFEEDETAIRKGK